jgi:hypothetical protein
LALLAIKVRRFTIKNVSFNFYAYNFISDRRILEAKFQDTKEQLETVNWSTDNTIEAQTIPLKHKQYHWSTDNTIKAQTIPFEHRQYHWSTYNTIEAHTIQLKHKQYHWSTDNTLKHRQYHWNTDNTIEAQTISLKHIQYHWSTDNTIEAQTIPLKHRQYHWSTDNTIVKRKKNKKTIANNDLQNTMQNSKDWSQWTPQTGGGGTQEG